MNTKVIKNADNQEYILVKRAKEIFKPEHAEVIDLVSQHSEIFSNTVEFATKELELKHTSPFEAGSYGKAADDNFKTFLFEVVAHIGMHAGGTSIGDPEVKIEDCVRDSVRQSLVKNKESLKKFHENVANYNQSVM